MEKRIRESLTYRTEMPGSIGAMLDFEYIDSNKEEGTATLSHKVDEREINIYGTLHGGIITWLMDSVMGILARAYTGCDVLVTVDIHVQFLRAIYAGETAVIKGRVTHRGSSIVNLVSELYVNDKLCATADAVFYKVEAS